MNTKPSCFSVKLIFISSDSMHEKFVENHWIFLGYYLVYLLPFLLIIFLPFCILSVFFLCLPDLYK